MNHGRRQTPARLSHELIELLAKQGDARSYAPGERLIVEGDASDALFILVSGQLKVFTLGPKERELVYNVLEPGEVFGEMFLDGEPRSASVKAVLESKCLIFAGDNIRELIRAHPDFAECVIVNLICRVRHATKTIRSLALDSVYERTVAMLEEVATSDNGIRRVPSSITQADIASRIGATREMVNHVLQDLTRGGFLSKEGRRQIVIMKNLPKRW